MTDCPHRRRNTAPPTGGQGRCGRRRPSRLPGPQHTLDEARLRLRVVTSPGSTSWAMSHSHSSASRGGATAAPEADEVVGGVDERVSSGAYPGQYSVCSVTLGHDRCGTVDDAVRELADVDHL